MAAIAEAVAGLVGGIGDLAKTGYDLWSNQRDFDYQKNLQNQIFEREDNAVQRRMVDLKAAGLNPNLAAGSTAGAGAVVGRSNTPSLSGNPVGTALDMASHVQQLRNQRVENQILNNQKKLSDVETNTAQLQSVFDRAALYNQLGIKGMAIRFVDGKPTLYSPEFKNQWSIDDSPLMKQLGWQVQNNRNSADLLQRDVDWYTADKLINIVGSTARNIGSFSGAYYNFNKRR